MSGPDGRSHLVGVRVLQQVAGGARLEGGVDALLLGEGRQRHHLHVGVAGADLTGGLDAVDGRHLEVHEDDIRSSPFGVPLREQSKRPRSAVRVADDLEVRLALEEGPAARGERPRDRRPRERGSPLSGSAAIASPAPLSAGTSTETKVPVRARS